MASYVPEEYVMTATDEEIIDKLCACEITPDFWRSIWDYLGMSKVSDVMMVSMVDFAQMDLKPVPRKRVRMLLDALHGTHNHQSVVPVNPETENGIRGNDQPPFRCPAGKDHCPKADARRKHLKHWLYQAAWHGCLPCVQYCIEVRNVDVNIESDNMKYTVTDWAEWAVERNVDGAPDVVTYLASLNVVVGLDAMPL